MMDADEQAWRKEFEVDPGTPEPMDMLDVLQDAAEDQTRRRRAAIEMQAAIAIQAILKGADIVEIASKCGFNLHQTEPEQDPTTYAGVMNRVFGHAGLSQPQSQEELFIGWLTQTLGSIMKDKFEGAGL